MPRCSSASSIGAAALGAACCSPAPVLSISAAHGAPSHFDCPSFSFSSSLPSSSSASTAAATTVVLQQQRRGAQTLKDIEKHGAKGTSKLLKDLFPDIAMEVDIASADVQLPSNVTNTPATSGAVNLDSILFDSGRRVPWRCKRCSSTWVASVVSRTILKKGCPACHERHNPLLADVNPRLLLELHPSKNTIFCEPEALEATDRQKVWWLCGSCNSSFQARICDRAQGRSPCPDCDRGQFGDFKIRKVLLEEFHPTRNGDLSLAKMRPTDRIDVWWLCHACGHEFVCPLSVRVAAVPKAGGKSAGGYGGCPKCAARTSSAREGSARRAASEPRAAKIDSEGGVAGAKKRRGRPSNHSMAKAAKTAAAAGEVGEAAGDFEGGVDFE